MATIITEGKSKRIDFYSAEGKRKSLRVGPVNTREAGKIKEKIEEILASQTAGTALALDVVKWLADRPAKLYKKLVKAGLARLRTKIESTESLSLGPFIDDYIARSDRKPSTKTTWKRRRNDLVSHFGENCPITDITVADAEDWRNWLRANRHHSKATVSKDCTVASQFFARAVKARIITENPFSGLGGTVPASEEFFDVSKDTTYKILGACSNLEYNAIFALARFGGLRIPSESNALKWSDINWEEKRFIVHASKTEQYDGKATRQVPLFSELRIHLDLLRTLAIATTGKEPEGYVIANHRGCNPRAHMERLVKKAGVEVWPKLFQSLRSTRQTELVGLGFPEHVVCSWLGNSRKVARKHYLHATDTDFARAVA